jgi:uncharacterized membrane protein YhaH (DUF805 family)
MINLSALGGTTVIISWLFTFLALISFVITTAAVIRRDKKITASEWMNFAALITGMVLIAQNTYAIFVEGQAEHQNDLSFSQVDKLSKVCTVVLMD